MWEFNLLFRLYLVEINNIYIYIFIPSYRKAHQRSQSMGNVKVWRKMGKNCRLIRWQVLTITSILTHTSVRNFVLFNSLFYSGNIFSTFSSSKMFGCTVMLVFLSIFHRNLEILNVWLEGGNNSFHFTLIHFYIIYINHFYITIGTRTVVDMGFDPVQNYKQAF